MHLRTTSRLATSVFVLIALATALLLSACGRKDDPLPPLRYAPAPARDLAVNQQGGVLILKMAYPQTTTSGQMLPGLDAVQIYLLRLDDSASSTEVPERTFESQAEQLFVLSGAELQSSIVGDRIETRFPIPEGLGETSKVVWAVRSVSSTKELSPFSNLAGVSFAPRIEPPTDLSLSAEVDGIRVDWTPSEGSLASNLYRRPATERRFGAPLATVEGEPTFFDRSASYGTRYLYALRAIASKEPLVESDVSIERELNYRDTFAPLPHESLLALGEQGGVRLVLEASPSSDATGFLVYRQDPRADFRQVTNDPVAGLEYLDSGLTPGLNYSYYTVVVDGAGNQGEPSDIVTATVPER